MTTETTTDEQIKSTGAALRAIHGKIAGVVINGGVAFFRMPTAEAWDEFAAIGADEGDLRRQAFRRMVREAFCCALVNGAEVGPEAFDKISAGEGPAWVGTTAGNVVNKLAGAKERAPTRFF